MNLAAKFHEYGSEQHNQKEGKRWRYLGEMERRGRRRMATTSTGRFEFDGRRQHRRSEGR